MTKIDKLKKEISEADTIIIGAGSELSTSAGFTYTGEITGFFSAQSRATRKLTTTRRRFVRCGKVSLIKRGGL